MKPITRIRLKKSAKYVIIIAAILSLVFAAFSIYGSQVGNYVVNVEQKKNINLSLFDSAELAGAGTNYLSFPGITDQTPCAYPRHIPDNIEDGIGSKNDNIGKRYIAFSFVVTNKTEFDVDIQMEMKITAVTQNVDAAIRVMTIVDGVRNIYAKPKDFPEADIGKPEDTPYLTTPFAAPTVICQQEYHNVKTGKPLKFTIVVWLEGEDNECDDGIRGGSVKMEMRFAGQ